MSIASTTTRRPPGPGGIGGRRALLEARRDPVAFLLRLARTYGDIAHFRAPQIDAYLLSHPDLVREVLVTQNHNFMKGRGLQEARRLLGSGLLTSEGGFHRRQRRLIQPLFHHQRIQQYGGVMVESAVRLRDRWADGEALDVHQAMTHLTLAIVGKTLFDTDIEESDARDVGRAMADAMDLFQQLTLPFTNLVIRLPLRPVRRFQEAKRVLDGIVYGMIRERRVTGDRGDLLSMLLAAQDEEGGGGMTDEQVRDEAMTIFLAGHETTANALTWTWYLLSQHPEVEAKLHAELDETLGDRLPSVEDLSNLRYTEMVLSESMRLYPPAWVLGRRALVDTEIGGYPMPAGSIAVTSQYIVHHDRRWFPDPYRFDPERWTPEAQAERPKYSYFPFGGGQRLCIGESFAWMEGLLAIATIARQWKFRLVPGHPVELLPRVTLRPKHGIRMTAHAR